MAMNEGPEEDGYKAGIEIGPDGKPTGNIICYPSFNPNCKVVRLPTGGDLGSNAGFLSTPEPTKFHDSVLIEATREINKILVKATQDPKRGSHNGSLHVYLAPDGPMLLWAEGMAMPTSDVRKGLVKKHTASA